MSKVCATVAEMSSPLVTGSCSLRPFYPELLSCLLPSEGTFPQWKNESMASSPLWGELVKYWLYIFSFSRFTDGVKKDLTLFLRWTSILGGLSVSFLDWVKLTRLLLIFLCSLDKRKSIFFVVFSLEKVQKRGTLSMGPMAIVVPTKHLDSITAKKEEQIETWTQ